MNDCEQYSLLQQTNLIAPPSRVGDSAKNAYHSNPENTVFDANRLICHKTDEADIERDMKHWSFQIVDKDGKPSIFVKCRSKKRDFVSKP
jgi:heat shock protein 5